MPTPRVFIIRHGETEWSLNGRHTGTTDLALTANGEARVRATGAALVGPDRLIAPRHVAHVYVSPRRRARRTLELLDLGCHGALPWSAGGPNGTAPKSPGRSPTEVQVTEDIREWDYGEYEGLTSKAIRQSLAERGEGGWDIWKDGCPGGESPEQVTARLDRLIADLRRRYHAPAFRGETDQSDVVIVAHGHILRAFAMRWIGKGFDDGVSLVLEAGGVGTLSYEHNNIDEPAIL